MPEQYTAIVKLSDTDFRLADPAQDIRGRKVIDCDGKDAGHIDELLIDDVEKKVRFARVASGGVLGIGAQRFLIPVELITRVTADTVYIARSCEHLADAPVYDPQVTLDDQRLSTIYGYYGLAPFWAPGYAYPAFPYYV